MLMMAVVLTACKPEKDPNNGGGNNGGTVTVTTVEPSGITSTFAICGAEAVVSQGTTLDEIGVCWSTSRNPTVEDAHLSTSNWREPFACTITGLEPRTEYHVSAYALCDSEYYYGEDKCFFTESNGGGGGDIGGGTGFINGHAYVDLGLPSGTLWATCNVGATSPEGYGDFFAWGETEPKTSYGWNNYKYCVFDPAYGIDGSNSLTKYCDNSRFGYRGFKDNRHILLPIDDAATANWGDGWCMPSWEEWDELLAYTTQTWTTLNGVNGCLYTASNGNAVFLPAGGIFMSQMSVGQTGAYYSRTQGIEDVPSQVIYCSFNSYHSVVNAMNRCYGLSVRAVHTENNIGENVGSGTYNGHDYIDLCLPSGTLWAACNIGAVSPEGYGYYLAWGETEPKSAYEWSNYQYCHYDGNENNGWNSLTKYCNNSDYGYNGFTDNLTAIQLGDDAATVNWGEGWCMPTPDQWEELLQNTTSKWTTQNGVRGICYVGANRDSLFIPAAGCYLSNELYHVGSYGCYWSNALVAEYPDWALYFYFPGDFDFPHDDSRCHGQSVRAVRSTTVK